MRWFRKPRSCRRLLSQSGLIRRNGAPAGKDSPAVTSAGDCIATHPSARSDPTGRMLPRESTRRTPPRRQQGAATARTIPRARSLRRKASVRSSAPSGSCWLAQSPRTKRPLEPLQRLRLRAYIGNRRILHAASPALQSATIDLSHSPDRSESRRRRASSLWPVGTPDGPARSGGARRRWSRVRRRQRMLRLRTSTSSSRPAEVAASRRRRVPWP